MLSGKPVGLARIEIPTLSAVSLSNGAGVFHLRGVEPGRHTLRIEAPGYATLSRDVVVANGVVTTVRLELVPQPLLLEGVTARVDRRPSSVRSLAGAELDALPARTVGDLVSTLPGVRVESRGRGGSEVPSIRGSGGDAVLVLVDGTPINDVVTGEADLSTVPAAAVSAIHVLSGGASARYGARAQGGVILVETGSSIEPSRGLELGFGSLGARTLEGTWGARLPLGALAIGAGLRRLGGRFEFDIPRAAGGGQATRQNAHAGGEHARLEWFGNSPRARLRLGFATERTERGLPGRSYAPSPAAAQELSRGRLHGSLDVSPGGVWTLGGHAYFVSQTTEHRDSAPPFGEPFDDDTMLRGAGAEVRLSFSLDSSALFSAGSTVAHTRVESTQLADAGRPIHRTDAGAWLTVSRAGPAHTRVSLSGRMDRSGFPSRWYASHDVGLVWADFGLAFRLGHRSSFSPPTLGDQFFREGVGVESNPTLQPERVPSEWLVGASYERSVSDLVGSLEVEAYRGDIHGMIIWLPDYRFVWSPRNQDVRRRGVETRARLSAPGSGVDLSGHMSWNRTTYARPGLQDVQVVYRPERTAGLVAVWASPRWRLSVVTDFTGLRYPVPNEVNELPGFWTTDVRASHRWRTPLGLLEVGVEIERVFDHEDSLIFAFPDPGRTTHISLRLTS